MAHGWIKILQKGRSLKTTLNIPGVTQVNIQCQQCASLPWLLILLKWKRFGVGEGWGCALFKR